MKPAIALVALACASGIGGARAADAPPDPDKAVLYLHVEAADAVIQAEHAAAGDGAAPEQLQAIAADMQRALAAVPATDPRHAAVAAQVARAGAAVEAMVRAYPDFAAARGGLSNLVFRSTRLSALWTDVIRGLTSAGTPAAQLELAHRQMYLLDRMVQRAGQTLGGGKQDQEAADELARDVEVYQAVLDDFAQGNAATGIARVEQEDARVALEKIRQWQDAQRIDTNAVLAHRESIAAVHAAAAELQAARAALAEAAPPAY
jgi:hypothetical protein